MADKYTKVVGAEPSVAEDAWKDAQIEKEYTPPSAKATMSYRGLESQVADIDKQIASLEDRKATVEAEMAKVKTAAQKK